MTLKQPCSDARADEPTRDESRALECLSRLIRYISHFTAIGIGAELVALQKTVFWLGS
jgi:hypothetical protein